MSEEQKDQVSNEEIEAQLEAEMDVAAEAQDETSCVEDDMMKWRDTAMRTAAEYDNYRKRMAKDKEEILKFANQRLLEELLPILDNFDMGMMAASADKSSMIYIGMNMVKKQLDEFLSSNGVETVTPEIGAMFDHNTQDALQSEVSEQEPGTILRVIRKGYTLKGRLIRPANVVVAAGEEHE